VRGLLSPWTASLSRLERALHREIPVEPIAIYRAGVGLLIFLEACTWLGHTRELFSSDGFRLPCVALPALPVQGALVLSAALVVAALTLTLGLFTRGANACVLVLFAFLVEEDGIDRKAIHSILVVVLALLLFTPSGAALSLDALRRRSPATRTCRAFVYRLIQLEFAQVYFFAGLTKMTNASWVSGDVLFHAFSGRWATPLGIWISGWLSPLGARAGALGTILYEIFAPVLLFVPYVRPWVITAGVLFHLGIQSSLSIGFLGPHFLLALLVLFPEPDAVRSALEWMLRFRQDVKMDHQ
jgi:hypothetical protein